jgi:hypothetical protein
LTLTENEIKEIRLVELKNGRTHRWIALAIPNPSNPAIVRLMHDFPWDKVLVDLNGVPVDIDTVETWSSGIKFAAFAQSDQLEAFAKAIPIPKEWDAPGDVSGQKTDDAVKP